MNRILRLYDVLDRTGLKKSTLYRLINSGGFPSPVALSARCRGWVEIDVDAWVAACKSGGHWVVTNLGGE